ncbi:uncharacterized protein [Setaria viridis]
MAQRGSGGGGGSAGTNHNRQPAMAQRGGGGLAGTNHNRQLATARAAAAMALRGGGGRGLAGINRNRQPAAAAAMAQRGVGVGVGSIGINDHNRRQQLLASYYRDLSLAPPPPAAVVGDNAGSLSDIEDPPLDLLAVNSARVAAAPPLTDAPGAGLGIRWFDVETRHGRRRRAEPSEEDDEGSSHRRRQRQTEDEASSEAGAASPEQIYEALKEIPDLGRADLLRAYSKLIHDARQFRCLMALPSDMRKDWLLMEIGNQ